MANLAALLEKEASAEIETLLSEARTRASEVVAKAKGEAEALIVAQQRSLANQHEAALVRARSSAQLEASSLKLRAQHEAVEGVFAHVTGEINKLVKDSKKFAPVLKKLLDEALEALDNRDDVAAIVVNPAHSEIAEEAVKNAKLKASIEVDESLLAGVRLKSKNSAVSVENSLFSRLDALKDDLAAEVSKHLFKPKA
jgi:vacuolar-type H+-ATPase subunit E/Vma4